jgi:hypothetical protein
MSGSLVGACGLVVSALLGAAAHAAGPSLADLEGRLRTTPVFSGPDATPEESMRRESALWRGVRVYGSTSLASVDEVVDIGRRRSYEQAAATVGLQWPLLGSRLRLDEEQQDRELASLALQFDAETRRRRALVELRRAYIALWAAQRRAELASGFVADEKQIADMLLQRTRAGLLLESDRLEFMSAFERARVELRGAESAQLTARDRVHLLLQEEIGTQAVQAPRLDGVCRASAATLDTHPELQWLSAAASRAQSAPRSSARYPWRSDLRVGYARSHEPDTGQSGGSGVISWSFDYPLGEREQWRADRARTRLQAARAAADYAQRLGALQNEIRRIAAEEALANASLMVARRSVEASEAKVRERRLRAGRLAGDVAEQLQSARYARYRAAVAQVDAEAILYAAQNEWTPLAPSNCRLQTQLRGRALYLWASEPLLVALQHDEAAPLMQRLARAQIDRLFLSLDAQQLAAAARDERPLRAALAAASRQGVSVELLLGEPSWMLPQHRDTLLATVERLRALPFAGLHLDLEPNQLDAAGGEGLQFVPDLLATLHAVRARSAWPLGLSVHPRYLGAPVAGQPLATHLQELGIEAAVMIYVADAQRVRETAMSLVERFPQLRLRVALSLERELDAAQSLAHVTGPEREQRIAQIEATLAPYNFAGVALQTSKSWLYGPAQ